MEGLMDSGVSTTQSFPPTWANDGWWPNVSKYYISTFTKWDQSSRNSVHGIYCNQVVVACFFSIDKQLRHNNETQNKKQGEQNQSENLKTDSKQGADNRPVLVSIYSMAQL